MSRCHQVGAAAATALLLAIGACAADAPPSDVEHDLAGTAAAPAVTERVQGVDRYATAVALSQQQHPGGSDVVVLASGQDYPDALVSAPVASAFSAPLLLTPRARLPAVVSDELVRLGASTVIVPGGEQSVSQDVVLSLQASGLDVRRVAGEDRYGTAGAVATTLVAPGRTGGTVLVATGTGFPDALVAAAAGAVISAPVLLLGSGRLPPATATALSRLEPTDVLIIGGRRAVSDDLLEAVRSAARSAEVVRVDGADRYATAAALQARVHEQVPREVFLTTGTDYPDALAAAGSGSPLLLAHSDCVPPSTAALMSRWSPAAVVAVGGTSALGAGASQGRVCGASG